MPPFRAALGAMPFASARHPSLQLGLLQAVARRRGFEVDTSSLNLDLARAIGSDTYETLCRYRGRLLGEWLFSLDAFGDAAPDQARRFLDEFGGDLVPRLECSESRRGWARAAPARGAPPLSRRVARGRPVG